MVIIKNSVLRDVPLCRFLQEPHGLISRKTALFTLITNPSRHRWECRCCSLYYSRHGVQVNVQHPLSAGLDPLKEPLAFSRQTTCTVLALFRG
jgi:hypothetical protein